MKLHRLFPLLLAAAAMAAPPPDELPEWRRISPFWTNIPDCLTTVNLHNNHGEEPLTVYPTLYLQDGSAVELASVELAPLGSAAIEVNATVNALGYTAPAFGGAIFRYRAEHGGRLAVETAVAMPANNILYSVESFTGFEKKSNAQHSTFWLPTSGSEVFFAAFNASDSAVALRPRLHLGDARFDLSEATIPPKGHFRRRLTAEQLAEYARRAGISGDLVGGVTLEHDGPADAVQATGWIDDRTKSYSNMMSFADPAAGAGPKLYGVQLLLGRQPLLAGPGQPVDLRTRVVLRNMTAGAVTAAATAYYSRGGAVERAALPGLRLAPFAAADYDLDALQRRGVIPPEVREVLLEVESFAAPGSVMGRAFSVSTDLSYGLYSVLESDGTGFWSGIYWSLKGDENTVMTIANIGDEETTAAVELAYPGGVARLRPLPVRPRETVTLNLRRDLPRMLAEGARLPPGAESGGYRVRSVEDPLRAELVVKQHVLSASKRTAAPFYGQCAYVTGIWLGAPWPTVNLLLGGTAGVYPYCNMSTGGYLGDYGAILQPDGGNQISITPQYGYTRTITGLAPGYRDMLHSSTVPDQHCGTTLMQGWPPNAFVYSASNWVDAFGIPTDGFGNVVLEESEYNQLVSLGLVPSGVGVIFVPGAGQIVGITLIAVAVAYIAYEAAQYIDQYLQPRTRQPCTLQHQSTGPNGTVVCAYHCPGWGALATFSCPGGSTCASVVPDGWFAPSRDCL